MSIIELILVLVGFGIALVIWQLSKINSFLNGIVYKLQSLDGEVFHLSQEKNPNYGQCDGCGSRGIVRHVIPKERYKTTADEDLFYCKACWWMSDSVDVSNEEKYYKDRIQERDKLAAKVGPR